MPFKLPNRTTQHRKPCGKRLSQYAESERVALELKIARSEMEKVAQAGLVQTVAHMDRSGTDTGHLVIFDRRAGKTWEERIWRRNETWRGHTIGVWGM